mgnify:CR=1 FL=1
MNLNKFLDVAPEVARAVAQGKPVVALESTIISHGMPYPQNVETALQVESIIRDNGAVPATIAILGGLTSATPAAVIGWSLLYGVFDICGYKKGDGYPL